MDPYGWGDQDEGLLFAQDASVPGRRAQQWELRMLAREAALKEVANSKLRGLLAYNKTRNCADVKIGNSVRFEKPPNRKSLPKWGGPACILEIDETGATARYQSQTFQAARNCVRKQVDEEEPGDKKGTPGLELSSDRYSPPALDPACAPLPSGETPGVTE